MDRKVKLYETSRGEGDSAYNPYLLKRLRAHMDIQSVSNANGLAYYVCSYIAKAEPDDLREALSNVIPSFRAQIMQIGNCVLKTGKLSAQEAAARIGNIQKTYSSSYLFLNTRQPSKRYKIIKPASEKDTCK